MSRLNPEVLRLYLVTDQSLTRGRSLADIVGAAVQGGVSCVQLREKNLATREFLAQALMLKKLLAPHGVPLVINDRMRDLVREKAALSALKAEARKGGMLYMQEEGLRLVVKGITSIDELLRVVK